VRREDFSHSLGRWRIYANTISMPYTCRSNWLAIQPTTGTGAGGHYKPLATDRYAAAKCASTSLLCKPYVNFSNVTAALPRCCSHLQVSTDSSGG
jgi:hypothetical protein